MSEDTNLEVCILFNSKTPQDKIEQIMAEYGRYAMKDVFANRKGKALPQIYIAKVPPNEAEEVIKELNEKYSEYLNAYSPSKKKPI